MQKLHKTSHGTVHWFDFQGNEYSSNRYRIPLIKMHKSRFVKFMAREEGINTGPSLWLSNTHPHQRCSEALDGRIGWRCFQNNHVVFDFSHSAFFLIRDRDKLSKLKKMNCVFRNARPIPCEIDDRGIVFLVDTDLGKKSFVLDSGASISLMKRESMEQTSHELAQITLNQFKIHDLDLGKTSLHLIDFCDKLDFDGILGIDFFMKYAIYIDFLKKEAIIIPSHQQPPD